MSVPAVSPARRRTACILTGLSVAFRLMHSVKKMFKLAPSHVKCIANIGRVKIGVEEGREIFGVTTSRS